MTGVVTSRQNPLIRHFRLLESDGAYRRQKKAFLCEGPLLLEEAAREGMSIPQALVCGDGFSLPAATQVTRVTPELLSYVSGVKSPQGVVFSCALPDSAPPERLEKGFYMVLDGVQDPGNVGAVLRSADAFAAREVILTGACADPYSPKCVRASMGAVFRLPVRVAAHAQAIGLFRASGIPLIAAMPDKGAADLRRADLRNAAVVIGSEGAGVSETLRCACASSVCILMPGRAQSLNAAVAASIILWERARQEG